MRPVFVAAVMVCAELLLVGCVMVPVPASKRMEGPKGKIEKLDCTFIQPGTTRRAEIETKLASIDLGMKQPELFLGRFKSSNSAFAGAMVGPPMLLPFGGRFWKSNNLLVMFDAAGIVTQVRNINDGTLDKELLLWLASHEQPITYPLRVPASAYHDRITGEGYLVMEERGMKFVELSQKKYTYFNGTYRDEPVENPRLLQYLFEPAHLKQFYGDASDRGELSRYLVYKRPARKKVDRTIRISVNPTPDELLAMLAYAKKNCPAVKFAGPKW